MDGHNLTIIGWHAASGVALFKYAPVGVLLHVCIGMTL
jgi:hypothetical protein